MYLLKHKTGDSFHVDFTKHFTEIDFKLSSYMFLRLPIYFSFVGQVTQL